MHLRTDRKHSASTMLLTAIAFLAVTSKATLATEIDVSYSSSGYTKLFTVIGAKFEEEHPGIKVNFRTPVPNSHEEHLQQTLRNQITGSLPDVSFQGSSYARTLVNNSVAVELDPFIAGDKGWAEEGYSSAIQSVGQLQERTYGLPFQISLPVVLFNSDLVGRAGGDPENLPQTWEGIIALAKKMDALDNNVSGGFFDYLTSGNWTFQAMITSQSKPFMTADDEVGFGGTVGLKALETMSSFADAGMVDMTQKQALQAFSAGTIGVLPTYSSALLKLEKQAEGRFDIEAVPWPTEGAEPKIPAGGRLVMMFTQNAEKQAAAWKFIKFVTSDETQAMLVRQIGAVPANNLAQNLLDDFYTDHPNQKAALAMVPIMTNWYSFPGENALEITNIIKDYLRETVTGEKDPETVQTDMVISVEKMLEVK